MGVVIAKLLRHALTIGGGAGLVGDDQVTQIAGALATLAGVGWSLFEAYLESRKKKQG